MLALSAGQNEADQILYPEGREESSRIRVKYPGNSDLIGAASFFKKEIQRKARLSLEAKLDGSLHQ
ncbi:MAG: hypothetical protein RIM99_17185 [Cyclobacteriaceae bacterium]